MVHAAGERVASSPPKPKLLEQLRQALRARHYSRRTEQTYCRWVRRYIFFHNVRHPAEMGEAEINAFLTHLAVKEKVSASTRSATRSPRICSRTGTISARSRSSLGTRMCGQP